MIRDTFSLLLLLFAVSTARLETIRPVFSCITPLNRIGQCISLRECRELTWLVQNKKHDTQAMRYFKKAVCGAQKSGMKVCCTSSNFENIKAIAPEIVKCGTVEVNQRIIGGEDVQPGDYPWMASLGYRQNGYRKIEWLCGGSLISSKYVLTAAHCVTGTSPKELHIVRLGELDLDESVEDGVKPLDILVGSVDVHEEYTSNPVTNDIALIRLKYPVQFTPHIKPICLPIFSEFRKELFNNQNAVVAGWGRTISTTGPFSSSLQQIIIPILEIDICKRAYSKYPGSQIDSRNLCAGVLEGYKDSCQGDSGGPLMWLNHSDYRYYAIGIVSYGYKCAQEGFPGVYTRVSEYVYWISLKMY